MLENREGQKVPNVTFRTRQNHDWLNVTTDEIFKGKTVAVFSLPGAFTPTCSSSHVPRFNELAPVFKKHGVDEIICISVNDAFVMNEWAEDQDADRIRFLPDGNGDFTEGMGLLVDKDDLGFGKRSWRYSMLVKDGTIEKMFIEPEKPGDPYEVSDADTMLDWLAPNAKKPHSIMMFSRKGCPFCARAKGMLHDAELEFDEIIVGDDVNLRAVRAVAQTETVPQVYIDGQKIGGSEEVETWLKQNGY
ncbi:glutathione peroxidase [Guyparkeria halophila]|uniref:Glutathione peroxidase n=1 Tax=Guyparkeria halophila TaxID=47960 RepID=A0ABZ0YZ96_9GAMM|nr:glutathione peroxidase [Guyparkeria halophila]WQH16552.1 glutathione peroxidase [Guyparkeria halophila]